MTAPRYLRFAQAILLTATTLPACSGADHPSSPPSPSAKSETVSRPQASPPADPQPASSPVSPPPVPPGPVAYSGSDAGRAVDASPPSDPSNTEQDAAALDAEEVDSRVPFSSGPIVPPELPECFA